MARILIVDDEPVVVMTLSRMLRYAGHDVWVADSALAGLARVEEDRPDALILDMRMPDLGGLEFMRLLRGRPGLAGIPVGIVTGDYFMNEQVLAELSALGATVRYKPILVEDLMSLVDVLLGGRPPAAANS